MNKDVTGKRNYITSLQNRIRNQRTEITILRVENKNLKTIIKSSSISKIKSENEPLTLDKCPRCGGPLYYPEALNCSCHIFPPCTACVMNKLECAECGYTPEGG